MKNIIEKVNMLNGFEKDMPELNKAYSIDATTVYTFNILTGAAKKQVLNLDFNNIAREDFQRAYIRAWYYLEYRAIESAFESFNKGLESDETEETIKDDETKAKEEAAREVVRKRYEVAREAVKAVKVESLSDIPFTVRLLAFADRKAKEYDVEVTEMFDSVKATIDKLNRVKLFEDKNRSMKPIKEALTPVCEKLWRADNNIILPYRFNANTRLSENVYRVSYKGMQRKQGKITATYANESEIIREVIYCMFAELQQKRRETKKTEEAKKQAERDGI